jgi:hypothetical protein
MLMTKEEHRSLILLISLLLFLVLVPVLRNDRISELALVFSLYIVMIAATVELAGKRGFQHIGIPLVAISMILIFVGYLHPSVPWVIAYYSMLVLFLGVVSAGLFSYLGRPGSINNGRLYGSVSLYFILALFWFAIYSVIDTIYPAAFLEAGVSQVTHVPRAALLYFSLETLTTLGYGDIVPIHPLARMLAALEAATGILYIAITVSRLVAAFQRAEK